MANLHQGSSTIALSEDDAYHFAIAQGFALLDKPIDDKRLKQALMNDGCGALATFEGWVRNHNNARPVTKLTYYGYEKLALNEGKKLVEQAYAQFDIEKFFAIHGIGDFSIGGGLARYRRIVTQHLMPAAGYLMPSKRIFLSGSKSFMRTVAKAFGYLIMDKVIIKNKDLSS